MGAFWESMQRADEQGIETMGEPVSLAGEAQTGIVVDLIENPGLVPGGERRNARFRVNVTREIGEALKDGDAAEVRGVKGRIGGFQDIGGSIFVLVEDENPWDGEVPGL